MASVEANGITIEYEERGSGEPLLLVMGLGGQLIDWPDALLDELAQRGFRVIAFDNRDAGLSTAFAALPPTKRELANAVVLRRPLRTDYRLPDMANDGFGLLDQLGIEGAHVVGMSMGGMIAQQMAIDHPDRVLSLTSIMSSTGNPRFGRPTARTLVRYLRRPMPTRDSAVDSAVDVFADFSGPTFDPAEFRLVAERAVSRSYRPDGTARQLAAILSSPDRTSGLQSLQMPALVIHGMHDTLVQLSGGIATAKAIPGARLVLFNDMGHDLPATRSQDIADEIASVAARAAGRTRRPRPRLTLPRR